MFKRLFWFCDRVCNESWFRSGTLLPNVRRRPRLPTQATDRTDSYGSAYCMPKLKLYVVMSGALRGTKFTPTPTLVADPREPLVGSIIPLGNGFESVFTGTRKVLDESGM